MLNNILNLEGVSILNKKQQKLVSGGIEPGTCAARFTDVFGNYHVYRNISRNDAIDFGYYGDTHDTGPSNWCCDSCGSASWL